MRTIIVKNINKKTYLSNYIFKTFPNLSKGKFFKSLRNKDIKINEKRINKDIILNDKDEIKLYISDNILFNLPQKLDYIYDDQNIAIIFKPQGILSNDETKNLDTPAGEYNYLDSNYISEIKKEVTEILDKRMKDYINKTQNEFDADINEFYKYCRKNFFTVKEYESYNFEEKYKDAKVNVKINISFNDSGLNIEK